MKNTNYLLRNSLWILIIFSCNTPNTTNNKSETQATDATASVLRTSAECEYCDSVNNDSHCISMGAADTLIYNFQKTFPELVAYGGTIDLRTFSFREDKSMLLEFEPYEAVKFHLCYEQVNDSDFLFIALEPDKCPLMLNGIGHKRLITSNFQNRIHKFDSLKTIAAFHKELENRQFNNSKFENFRSEEMTDSAYIKRSSSNFFKSQKFAQFNKCPMGFFKFDHSIGKIASTFDNVRSIRYFFGLDTTSTVENKIRVIFTAVDSTGNSLLKNRDGVYSVVECSNPKKPSCPR